MKGPSPVTDPNNPQQPYPIQGGQGQPGQPYYPPQPGQPYPGYPATEPPKKKRKKWPWILLAIIVVIIAIVASCSALIGGAVNSVDQESKRVVDVTYEITGDGPTASATYTTGNLDIAQAGPDHRARQIGDFDCLQRHQRQRHHHLHHQTRRQGDLH